MKYLVILALFGVLASARMPEDETEMKLHVIDFALQIARKTCLNKYNLPTTFSIEGDNKYEDIPEESKCYGKCIFETIKLWPDQGIEEFREKTVNTFFSLVLTTEDNERASKCREKLPPYVDECEAIHRLITCKE